MSKPYLTRYPGDRITADDWNAVQTHTRAELEEARATIADLTDRLTALETMLSKPAERPGTGIESYVKDMVPGEGTFATHWTGMGPGGSWSDYYTGWNGISNYSTYQSASIYQPSGYPHWWTLLPNPSISISLKRKSTLVLSTQMFGTYNTWVQFCIESNKCIAPIRILPRRIAEYWSFSNYCPSYNWSLSGPESNFEEWVSYHQEWWRLQYARWPASGARAYSNQSSTENWAFSHHENITLPAGDYTIWLGFSGTAKIWHATLRATVIPV